MTILFLYNLIMWREENGSVNNRVWYISHISIYNLGTISRLNYVDKKHDNIPDFIFYWKGSLNYRGWGREGCTRMELKRKAWMSKRCLAFLGYDCGLQDKSVFKLAQKFTGSTRVQCNNNLMKECLTALAKFLAFW